MTKYIILPILAGLFSWATYAQTNVLPGILTEIEQNNTELKSYSSLIEGKYLGLKSANNLPDPEFGGYYMPFGVNNTGDYTEFQITQTMLFPTVYKLRGNIIEMEKEKLSIEFEVKRQTVLSSANKHILHLLFLNSKKEIAETRLNQAKKLSTQISSLYEMEKVGVLDFNKSKIALMQENLKYTQIDNDITAVLLLLKNLNGGIEVTTVSTGFTDSLGVPSLDSIIMDRERLDPNLLLLRMKEEIAEQQIKLNKSHNLPNLTAGYNYQGVAGNNYSGVYGGISIPIWSNRHKIEEAKVNFVYQKGETISLEGVKNTLIQNQHNEYNNLLKNYHEYQDAMTNLNNSELLLKSYELGQITFITYYNELQFYAQAQDIMLEIEYQLHQLKAELFKYKL